MLAATQRQLRRVDAELAAVRAERLNLESELASVQAIAAAISRHISATSPPYLPYISATPPPCLEVQAIAAGEISALEDARALEVGEM